MSSSFTGFVRNKKAHFVHSHIHLPIKGECFTHSLHSRECIHSIHVKKWPLSSGQTPKFRKFSGVRERVVLAEQKKAMVFDSPAHPNPERGHIRQNRPFTKPPFCRGRKINANFFCTKFFDNPSGPWTSAPKIVDVRTKKCVFLRPRWWGETF